MNETTSRVVVGMDPHKRSVTIEVMSAEEAVVGGGRFATDQAGFAAMVRYVSQFPIGSGQSRAALGSVTTSR